MHSFVSVSHLRTWLRWSAAVAVMALLFLWCPYQNWSFTEKVSVLVGWARVLAADESGEWVFCPFVPLVSLGLAWRHRAQLKALPLRGQASGLGILLLGAFVYWIGYKAATGYPGFAATQLVLAGLIVWLCGWAWMRVLVFPWMFLVFMWPSFPLEAQLAVPMRLMAANLTAKILSIMDIAAISHGSAVVSAADLRNSIAEGARFQLDVAAACSGIRSLYALLMLAAFSGYWFLHRWRPRGVLFLSALPLALVGNIVRLVLLGVMTIWFGEEFAVGRQTVNGEETSWFHQVAGLAVYAVALGGIFGLCSLLERSRWNRQPKRQHSPDVGAGLQDDSLRVTAGRAMVAMAFCGALLAFCSFTGSKGFTCEAGVNVELPTSIGQAQGADVPMTAREHTDLPADITIKRMMYTSPTTLPTQVAVVLDGAAGRGLHQPEQCAVTQAWGILEKQVITVQVADRHVDATMLRLFRDEKDPTSGQMKRRFGIHVFWFQGARGVSAPNHFGHQFRNYWESVFKNAHHRWALMSFSTYLPANMSGAANCPTESSALADLKAVIAQLGPVLLKP